jgi:hypothetical protein
MCQRWLFIDVIIESIRISFIESERWLDFMRFE